MAATGGIRDAIVFALSPPPIPALGMSAGFNVRLQDRADLGHEALVNARNMFLGMAAQSPILAQVRPDGLEDAPQIRVDIDRERPMHWVCRLTASMLSSRLPWARPT